MVALGARKKSNVLITATFCLSDSHPYVAHVINYSDKYTGSTSKRKLQFIFKPHFKLLCIYNFQQTLITEELCPLEFVTSLMKQRF
jgi:hypothetical protein